MKKILRMACGIGIEGEEHMTQQEILEIIKLLSAVESWSFADKHQMPDYLLEQLEACLEVLEKELLK